MDSSKTKVMVAGHICLDITPGFPGNLKGSFKDIFAPGKLINVQEAVIGTGGAVSNTGLAMAKLGIEVKLNGKVGDDEFGRIIKTLLGREMSDSFATVQDQSTSYSIAIAVPGIDRIFLHHPGTNDTFGAEDVDYQALENCRLFHFGYPTLMKRMYQHGGQQLSDMYKKVKNQNVVTSLDMTLPDPNSESGTADWENILANTLPYVDIFLPSVEEIAYMIDRPLFEKRKAQSNGDDPVLCYTADDCSRICDKLLNMGTKIAAVKMGIKGYFLQTAGVDVLAGILPSKANLKNWSNRQIWACSYKAEKFATAAGAGDATIAGFLTAFLNGHDPVESVKAANILGWQNIRQVDTLSGIEDWPKTLKMIKDKDKENNFFDVESQNWNYSESDRLYYGPDDSLK